MPKIVALSDTHGKHLDVKVPDGDILVHAGDLCSHGVLGDAMHFVAWFNTHPHRHKVFIAGNHDWIFDNNAAMMESLVKREFPEVHYLNDSGVELDGLKFWGSPVQPRFYNWSFNRDRGEEIQRHWNMIPEGTDVLITHGPPYGICDEAYRPGYNITEHTGCENLRDTVLKIAPKLHLFGHIHYSGQTSYVGPRTTYANVAMMNEDYVITGKPMIFDIDNDGTVTIVPS